MNLLRHSLERVPMHPRKNQACRPKLNFRYTEFWEVRQKVSINVPFEV